MAESKVHSFIIKLLMDDDEAGQSKWHGYITHVPDGARRYLRDLDQAISFIESYLAEETTHATKEARRLRWLKWPWRRQ